MELMYFVAYVRHNKNTGGVAYKTELGTTNQTEAEKKFYSLLGEYIGGADFDFVSVIMYDSYGNMLDSKYWRESEETPANAE